MTIQPNFTTNDLFEEIKRAIPQAGDEFLTTAEMAKALGVSQKVILKWLHTIDSKRLIPGTKPARAINGIVRNVSAYKITPQKGVQDDD